MEIVESSLKLVNSIRVNRGDIAIDASGLGGGISQDLVEGKIIKAIEVATVKGFTLRGGQIVP